VTFTPHAHAAGRAGLLGLLLGVVILGIGGRVLMRIVAVATSGTGGFSLGGTLEVVLAGALFGGLAGLFLPLFPGDLGRWRPVLHAAAVCVVIGMLSGAARSAAGTIPWPTRALVLIPFAGLVLLHSYLVAALSGPRGSRAPMG
jgi:hypothetical protein